MQTAGSNLIGRRVAATKQIIITIGIQAISSYDWTKLAVMHIKISMKLYFVPFFQESTFLSLAYREANGTAL